MNFFTILKLIISLLPQIIEIVKALETAIPAGGKGQDKLNALQEVLQTIYANSDVGDLKNISFDKLWSIVNGVTCTVVKLFNTTKSAGFQAGDAGSKTEAGVDLLSK